MILICDHRGNGLEESLRPLREAGLELEATRTLRETRDRLVAEPPSLLVIDPRAGGGLVELEEIDRLRGQEPRAPILLVTDPGDPGPALQAARALGGEAWDLVRRDAPLEEFLIRIERLMAQSEQSGELDSLRYHAAHDDRTGLLRPRFFQARLLEHFSAAQRHHLELALVLLDLDDFGRVNKVYDHTVGDQVITRVGRAIQETLRAEDVAGRLGGDEFAIVLPYTGPIEAAAAVRRLRDTLAALSGTIRPEGQGIPVGASIGFETTDGTDIESVQLLRRHAEIALRRAKRAGGGRGVYFRSPA